MKVIAVVPAYHEEDRIGNTLRAVLTHVHEIIVVDDGSRDHTAERARQAGVRVLRHAVNRGQGASLRTGTAAALGLSADIILHIDADGQHDPECIPDVLAPLKENIADVVFGSRFMGREAVGMPLSRKILLFAARAFNALVVGVPRKVTDPQSGFRAFSAAAARQIDFRHDRMAHCSEILRLVTHSSLRWMEAPVRVHYSSESLKKGQKPWDAARIAWQLFIGGFMK